MSWCRDGPLGPAIVVASEHQRLGSKVHRRKPLVVSWYIGQHSAALRYRAGRFSSVNVHVRAEGGDNK